MPWTLRPCTHGAAWGGSVPRTARRVRNLHARCLISQCNSTLLLRGYTHCTAGRTAGAEAERECRRIKVIPAFGSLATSERLFV